MIYKQLVLATLSTVTISLPVHAQASAQCAPAPATMRAARILAKGGPEALRIENIPVPKPGRGEVLVRVHFASINPVDWKKQEAGEMKFPATPGGDFSGVIVARGAGVTQFACGTEVAGIADPDGKGGSYAEYAVVPLDAIVAKPARYTMAEAAAYPTVSIATWRFLIATAAAKPGDRVLVHGGAGGVGSMVIQAAKAMGAHVTATASLRNHEFLKQLGTDVAIDYTTTRFEDVAKDMDVVVDAVGGETTTRSAAVLRAGGRMVSSASDIPASMCAGARFTCPPEGPWDIQRGLAYVAPLIAQGKFRVYIDSTYPLDAIVTAQQHNRSGRTRGKVVVDMGATRSTARTGAFASNDVRGATPRVNPAVLVPLQAYLDGHATGLESHFRRAFAEDAMLVGIKDGQYRQWPARDYITASSSGRAPADEAKRRRVIKSVSVTGKVATAVLELDYPDMKAQDHMTLLERNGEWRIVVKAYDAMTPAPVASPGKQD